MDHKNHEVLRRRRPSRVSTPSEKGFVYFYPINQETGDLDPSRRVLLGRYDELSISLRPHVEEGDLDDRDD